MKLLDLIFLIKKFLMTLTLRCSLTLIFKLVKNRSNFYFAIQVLYIILK